MKNGNFKKLLKQVKVNKPILFLGLILTLIGTISSFAIPWYAKSIIDGNYNKTFFISLIGVVVLSTILNVFGHYCFNKISIVWVYKLRNYIIPNLLDTEIKFLHKENSSELSTKILNYTEEIKNVLSQVLASVISILVSICFITVLFVISWKLTLVLLISLVFMVILLSPISSLASKVYEQNQKELAHIIGHLSHIISEIKLVKSYNSEEIESKNFSKINDKVKKLSIKLSKTEACIEPIVMTSFIGILFLMFVFGGMLVARNELTLGGLIAFCLYIFQILNPMINLGNFFKNVKKIEELSKNIIEVLEIKKEKYDGKSVNDILKNEEIKFNNISFKYNEEDEKLIIDNFNVSINPNETLALVGPSGSGKSTILNLIERFYTVSIGDISVGNSNINEFDLKQWRKKISYVEQSNAVINGTIRENITYGLDENVSDEFIFDILKQVGAFDFVQNLPEGLNTFLEENGNNLSGGQLQRLMIARAFVKNPDILLLDEVTSSLDSEAESVIKDALNSIKNKKTIIIVAHRLSTVKSADRIIFLDNGIITGIGNHEQLLNNHELYKKYVENQMI